MSNTTRIFFPLSSSAVLENPGIHGFSRLSLISGGPGSWTNRSLKDSFLRLPSTLAKSPCPTCSSGSNVVIALWLHLADLIILSCIFANDLGNPSRATGMRLHDGTSHSGHDAQLFKARGMLRARIWPASCLPKRGDRTTRKWCKTCARSSESCLSSGFPAGHEEHVTFRQAQKGTRTVFRFKSGREVHRHP